jgi:hypothetical protein
MRKKTYKHNYDIFWVSVHGSGWSKFTLLDATEKKSGHKKNISMIKNHPLLIEHRNQLEIIKPL